MKAWIHGLLSAVISGIATLVSVKVAIPEAFDWEHGWQAIGKLVVINAVINTALYLKQSPLPNGTSTNSTSSVASNNAN